MPSTNHFDQPVREFLAYLQVEAGLASATLSAYASDLAAKVQGMLDRGVISPGGGSTASATTAAAACISSPTS